MATVNETIARAIAASIEGNEGTFFVEVEMDDMTVYVDGGYEIDGYEEDDYSNGTGAWVTTYVVVSIESVEAYNEDGETIDIACDLSMIERYAENELAA